MPPPLTQTMYLRYNTKKDAEVASADFWKRILGHDPYGPEWTQMSLGSIHCPNNNTGYLVLTEPTFSQIWPLLTPQEQSFVDANMVPATNVQVKACLDAIRAQNPVPG